MVSINGSEWTPMNPVSRKSVNDSRGAVATESQPLQQTLQLKLRRLRATVWLAMRGRAWSHSVLGAFHVAVSSRTNHVLISASRAASALLCGICSRSPYTRMRV